MQIVGRFEFDMLVNDSTFDWKLNSKSVVSYSCLRVAHHTMHCLCLTGNLKVTRQL